MTSPSALKSPPLPVDPRGADAANLNATQARDPWIVLRPWHYVVSLAAVFGCTAAVVIVVLTHAAVR